MTVIRLVAVCCAVARRYRMVFSFAATMPVTVNAETKTSDTALQFANPRFVTYSVICIATIKDVFFIYLI
jgi:hypothetical protein